MTIEDFFLNQKRVNVCKHRIKTVPRDSFGKVPPEWMQDGKAGGMERMDEKLYDNHLWLIPALCLEDRTN